jgi:hypothetical protein
VLAKMFNIIEQEFLHFWGWCIRPRQLEDGYQIGLLVLIAGGLIKWQFNLPVFAETVLWSGAIILVGSFCWELFNKFRSLLKNATLGAIILFGSSPLDMFNAQRISATYDHLSK